jgi:hypothetical protein
LSLKCTNFQSFFSRKRLVASQQIPHGLGIRKVQKKVTVKKDVSREISINFNNTILVDVRRPTFFKRQTKNNWYKFIMALFGKPSESKEFKKVYYLQFWITNYFSKASSIYWAKQKYKKFSTGVKLRCIRIFCISGWQLCFLLNFFIGKDNRIDKNNWRVPIEIISVYTVHI